MRILVTGGTGFIGSNIALELIKQGHEVLITGHDAEQSLPGFQGKFLQTSLHGIDWDAIGKVDVLFHQAAINNTVFMDRREMMRANVEAPQQLFEHVVKNGCRKIVYASSTAVYGDVPPPYREDGPLNPLNPYAESKKMLDEFAMGFAAEHPEVRVVGLRYCNVYGPRESHKGKRATMIYQLAHQIIKGSPKLFKFGEQKRDYIYVKDVVKANLLAMDAPGSCVVNCAFGKATSFNEILALLGKTMGVKRDPEYIDNPFEGSYQNHTECDMSLAKEKIGFQPDYDIEKGIADYYASGFLV